MDTAGEGTWVGTWKGTKNPNAVKELIKYVATDDTYIEAWAKDTGDVVSNKYVVAEPYLDGQNHYSAFAAMAPSVNDKLSQGTDQAIEGIFSEETAAYVNGKKSKRMHLKISRRK